MSLSGTLNFATPLFGFQVHLQESGSNDECQCKTCFATLVPLLDAMELNQRSSQEILSGQAVLRSS